jgi:hypothetical protein
VFKEYNSLEDLVVAKLETPKKTIFSEKPFGRGVVVVGCGLSRATGRLWQLARK